MNRNRSAEIPHYLGKLISEAGNRQLITGVHEVKVYHDSWCSIFRGGECDCNPDVDMSSFPAKN